MDPKLNGSNSISTQKVLSDNDTECQQQGKYTDFDDVLQVIGGAGKYQQWLLWGFVCPFTVIMPVLILNTIFMMYEPEHWCHVPGKPTNMSIEEWRNLTIPMKSDTFSQCQMYETVLQSQTNDTFTTLLGTRTADALAKAIVDCNPEWGWDFNRNDYIETLVSQFNWVCEKKSYATEAFTLHGVGKCVGTIVFGWAGDKFGRKRLFFLTILFNVIPRLISLFIAHNFHLFLLMQFLNGTSFPMMYILPFSIITEICDKDFRSKIYSMSWMVWVAGLGGLPLIAYLLGHWFWIGLATSLPAILILLYYDFLPESPRLLLGAGKIDESLYYVEKIGTMNGTIKSLKPGQLRSMLVQVYEKQKEKAGDDGGKIGAKTAGFWTLFTKFNVAKYTIYVCIAWSVSSLIYYGVTLNTTAMAGNHFLNFFILAVIELPAGFVAWLGLVDKTGRRWTQAFFLLICAITFCVAGFAVVRPNLSNLVIVLVVVAKFSVSLTTLIVNLQANEIFPTPIRATGIGLASTIAEMLAIGSPGIVYLHKVHVAGPYIAFTLISIVGAICSLLLPETVGLSLPETLEDSNKLGENTRFWKLLPVKGEDCGPQMKDSPLKENTTKM